VTLICPAKYSIKHLHVWGHYLRHKPSKTNDPGRQLNVARPTANNGMIIRQSALPLPKTRPMGVIVCVQGYGRRIGRSYILAMCSHLFISAAHKTHQGQLTLTQAISALVRLSVRPCRRLERLIGGIWPTPRTLIILLAYIPLATASALKPKWQYLKVY